MSHKTIKVAAVAIAVAAMSLFAAGCSPECVDRFDCTSKGSKTQQFTCVSGICKAGSPDPGGAADGGADAGP